MNIKLAENIKTLRKEHNLTQEQLAEALGVTVGAVYKWESEKSIPEVGMLMEIADFFDVSVDVLLGYELRKNDVKSMVERLKDYVHSREADDALLEADKALKKYPNNFEVVYRSAALYRVRGYDNQNEVYFKRAMELYERSMELIDQNTDEIISELSIQTAIAELYMEMGQPEKAVEILKKNNPSRINHGLIGNVLACGCNKPEEAMKYLSTALIDSVVSQIFIVTGFVTVYMERGDYQSVIEVSEWLISILQGLEVKNHSNFLEKTESLLLVVQAHMYYKLDDKKKAMKVMKEAKVLAKKFDAQPTYGVEYIRFMESEEKATAHDSLGETAMEAIEKYILTDVGQHDEIEFIEIWERIKKE